MSKSVPTWAWVFIFPLVLGAPFVGRAFFVDDHYQMLMARGVMDHPARPYDFLADDNGPRHSGWDFGQPPRMVNPPLHHYLMGLFWKISHGRLWGVRSLSLLLAGASAVLSYLVASRLMVPPGPATVLSVMTPALWLTSYSLLIDGTLGFFFLGALWTWMEGLRRRSWAWLLVSGTLMGLTMLTKYTGLLLFGVAALYWWADREGGRRWRSWLVLLAPAAMLAGWGWWTTVQYGGNHFIESSKRAAHAFSWGQGVTVLAFFSGVLILPLSGWVFARPRERWYAMAAAAVGALFLAGPLGGFSPLQASMLATLTAGGLLFLLASLFAVKEGRSPYDFFLVGWIGLGLIQMGTVMSWVAARYYVTLALPSACLFLRLCQDRWRLFPSRLTKVWAGTAALLFMVSLCLAVGDYLQAQTQTAIARDVAGDRLLSGGRRGIYLGDSFTSSYLKTVGWEPGFPSTEFRPGDLVLRQEVIMPPWWLSALHLPLRPLKSYVYPSGWPFRLMDNRGSAGFYASCWGALPFTWSRGPLERYVLYEVIPSPTPSSNPPPPPPSGSLPNR